MDLRVQLKICEGCGCLWYRPQCLGSAYCRRCETKLREFPVNTQQPRGNRRRRVTDDSASSYGPHRSQPPTRNRAVAHNPGGAE